MVTYVVEVSMFNSKAKCDLPGSLEAAMASDVIQIGCYRQYAQAYQGY